MMKLGASENTCLPACKLALYRVLVLILTRATACCIISRVVMIRFFLVLFGF